MICHVFHIPPSIMRESVAPRDERRLIIVAARQQSDIIVLPIAGAYYIIAYVILNTRHDARLFCASNARVRALSRTLKRVRLPLRVVTGSRTLLSL